MGFTFNNKHSDDFGIYFKTNSIPYIAPKRQQIEEIQGKDGNFVFEDGYNNVQIELNCVIINQRVVNRRKQARQISAWLANTGKLIFDYEKDIEYNVLKVTNSISAALEGTVDEFSIIFECEPYQTQTYYNDNLTWEEANLYWSYADLPWIGGYERIFNVTVGDIITLQNKGTYKALPIIILDGIASEVNLGDFIFSNLNGKIYIDCKNKVVYSINGNSKINEINNFEGNFIELQPGENTFNVAGNITNLNIEFDYKNTYL